MAKSFTLTVADDQLVGLADRLDKLTAEEFERVAVRTVNEVGQRTYDLARGRMNEGLSLTDAYLQRKMAFRPAEQGQRPRSVVVAFGNLTTLGHYNPRIITQPVKNKAKSKGNPALGIPAGQKLSAVTVAVRRGGRKTVREGSGDVFMIPRFRDTEGSPLIFQRLPGKTSSGKSRLKALLGPSVYQLFRYQITSNNLTNDVEDDLSETLAQFAEAAVGDLIR